MRPLKVKNTRLTWRWKLLYFMSGLVLGGIITAGLILLVFSQKQWQFTVEGVVLGVNPENGFAIKEDLPYQIWSKASSTSSSDPQVGTVNIYTGSFGQAKNIEVSIQQGYSSTPTSLNALKVGQRVIVTFEGFLSVAKSFPPTADNPVKIIILG